MNKQEMIEKLLGQSLSRLLETMTASEVARKANLTAIEDRITFSVSERHCRGLAQRLRASVPTEIGIPHMIPASYKAGMTKLNKELFNDIVDILNYINTDEYKQTKHLTPSPDMGGEDVGLVISDWHIGKYCVVDGKVVYSVDKAEKKIAKMKRNIDVLIKHYIKSGIHKVDDLQIFCVGDIVDSEIVYETQVHNIERPVIDQIAIASKALSTLIERESKRFKKVFIHTVAGNHGRGGSGMHPASNWDNVVYLMTKMATKNIPNVKWNISYNSYNNAVVKGHRIHMRHGNEILPQTQTAFARAKLGGWHRIHKFDACIFGHYHEAQVCSWNGKKIFFNGSLVEGDDYGESLAKGGKPEQLLFGISKKRLPSFLFFQDLRD